MKIKCNAGNGISYYDNKGVLLVPGIDVIGCIVEETLINRGLDKLVPEVEVSINYVNKKLGHFIIKLGSVIFFASHELFNAFNSLRQYRQEALIIKNRTVEMIETLGPWEEIIQ